jgi:hypothetical protein
MIDGVIYMLTVLNQVQAGLNEEHKNPKNIAATI